MTDEMKKSPLKSPVIGNALIWAAMMLATALILSDVTGLDKGDKTMLMILQISGWFMTNQLVTKGSGLTAREEWACVRRLFGGK